MCTQNVQAFVKSDLVSTHALFLNQRGRVVLDAMVTKIPHFEAQEAAFYIDVHKQQASEFTAHIEKYLLKKDVEIHDLSDLMEIYAVFSEGSCPEGEEGSRQMLQEVDEGEKREDMEKTVGYTSFVDPRTQYMGTRSICVGEALELEEQQDVAKGTQEHYDLFRLMQGVIEGPPASGHIPHFLNFHYLNSISTDKGCYIGQELTARTATQGEVKRVLLPCCCLHPEFLDSSGKLSTFTVEGFRTGPTTEMAGQRVFDSTGQEVGKVITSLKSVGLVAVNAGDVSGQKYTLETGSEIAFWKPMWLQRVLDKVGKKEG